MAVAGYNKKHIDIELKENNLTITCSKKNETPPEDAVEFVHKGIAERNFYKTFALAEHVELNYSEKFLRRKNLKLLKSNNFYLWSRGRNIP